MKEVIMNDHPQQGLSALPGCVLEGGGGGSGAECSSPDRP